MGKAWGEYDHFLVFFEINDGSKKSPRPFKFDSNQLLYEGFVKLIKQSLTIYDNSSQESPSSHFANNLKKIRQLFIKWSGKKKESKDCALKSIEVELVEKYNENGFSFYSEETKEENQNWNPAEGRFWLIMNLI